MIVKVKQIVIAVFGVAVLGLACGAYEIGVHRSHAAAANNCVAAADEQCPSAQWDADYKVYQQLVSDVATDANDPKVKALQEKQDRLNGLVARMTCKVQGYVCQIPGGYSWNESKRKFELIKPPPAQTAASPAVNAPPPTPPPATQPAKAVTPAKK